MFTCYKRKKLISACNVVLLICGLKWKDKLQNKILNDRKLHQKPQILKRITKLHSHSHTRTHSLPKLHKINNYELLTLIMKCLSLKQNYSKHNNSNGSAQNNKSNSSTYICFNFLIWNNFNNFLSEQYSLFVRKSSIWN